MPSHKTLFIPNVTTDVGLSPPYNSLFTFFGQFFDHGVDQTVKGGGTVFVPLQGRRPAGHARPGPHRRTRATRCPPNQRFMVLTRAQNQPGRRHRRHPLGDGADDIQDANNTDTPWVDQSQTYTSHPSHQVFLREYVLQRRRPAGLHRQAARRPSPATGTPDGHGRPGPTSRSRPPTCSACSSQDKDVTNVPMLAADPYGKFIPGPARGLPQYVTATGLVEGDLAAPVAGAGERRCTSTRRS